MSAAGGNAAITLKQRQTTGFIQLWWSGGAVCPYAYQATWAPTNGNLYFIALDIATQNATVGNAVGALWVGSRKQICGASPNGPMWRPNLAPQCDRIAICDRRGRGRP